jgi:NAD(P)-dependent dehydrogenase (short-subunit alcohol dehydrogenase family)
MSGVVVTGAASGIGRASAEALVADGRKVAGAHLVVDGGVTSRHA